MNCKQAEQQIELFRENSLSEQAESRLRDHLGECRKCRQMLTGLDALDRDLKALFEGNESAVDMADRVSLAVADSAPTRQSIHLIWLKPALAACLVAALGILWLRHYDPSSGVQGDPMLAELEKFEPAEDSRDGVGEPFVIGDSVVAEYSGESPVHVIHSRTGLQTLVVDAFPAGSSSAYEEG